MKISKLKRKSNIRAGLNLILIGAVFLFLIGFGYAESITTENKDIPIDKLNEKQGAFYPFDYTRTPSLSNNLILGGLADSTPILIGSGQINAQSLPSISGQSYTPTQYDGYIIKLKDKSITEKSNEIDERLKALKSSLVNAKTTRANALLREQIENLTAKKKRRAC